MKAPYDLESVLVEAVVCAICRYCYRKWPDGPSACPQCVPGQPKTFAERRSDPDEFLGSDWVWVQHRGPWGLWCPLDEFVLFPKYEFDEVRAIVREFPPGALDGGSTLLPQLARLALKGAQEDARLSRREPDEDLRG